MVEERKFKQVHINEIRRKNKKRKTVMKSEDKIERKSQ